MLLSKQFNYKASHIQVIIKNQYY